MHSITNSDMYASRPVLTMQPPEPKQLEQSSSFQTVMDEEIFDPGGCRGCNGSSNSVDMDAFFAAWGTDDSTYDVDGNGIVDGSDLTILLSRQNDTPMPGSVDDVIAQWGAEGPSSADLNGDGIVDGADLMMALAGPATSEGSSELEEIDHGTKLENLLADWGSNNVRSDFTGDGIVNGEDLAYLLGHAPATGESTQTEGRTVPTPSAAPNNVIFDAVDAFGQASARESMKDMGVRVFEQLKGMGFESQPPSNLMQLVDAFKLNPAESKGLLTNIVDLFGGRDGSTVAHA